MGVLWKVTKEGWVKPVTLSEDPAGVLEGFSYYNSTLKVWRMFTGTVFISMSSGTPPSLQDVTDVGATTTNAISLTGAATLTLPAGASIGEFSIDGGFAGNSDAAVPTEKATKTLHDSHANLTSNPHTVTAAQVGNAVAQWNADKFQGVDMSAVAPTDNQVITFDSAGGGTWQAETPAGGIWKLQTSGSDTGVVSGTSIRIQSLPEKVMWKLVIKIKNNGGSQEGLQIQFNNDSGSNYNWRRFSGTSILNTTGTSHIVVMNLEAGKVEAVEIEFSGATDQRHHSMKIVNGGGNFNQSTDQYIGGIWLASATKITEVDFTINQTFDYDFWLFFLDV